MIRQSVLANGITVVTNRFNEANGAYLHWHLGGGSCAERKDYHGANHLLEHLRCNRHNISIPIEDIGGEVHAFTTNDSTEMFAHVWPDATRATLDRLLTTGLKYPILAPAELETERRRVIVEVIERSSQPLVAFAEETNAHMFKGMPRAHPVGGTPKVVATHDFNKLSQLHQRLLVGPNIRIIASGAVEHEPIVQQVSDLLGDIPAGPMPRIRPSRFRSGGFRLYVPNADTVEVILQYRADAQNSPRRPAYIMLQELLAGSRQSVLFKNLSYTRGLVYGVSSEYNCWKHDGAVAINLTCKADQAQRTINALARLMTEMPDHITQVDFDRAQRAYTFKLANTVETHEGWGARAMNDLTQYGHIRSLDDIRQQFGAVTFADVQQVARDLLKHKPFISAMGEVQKLRLVEPFDNAVAKYNAKIKGQRVP